MTKKQWVKEVNDIMVEGFELQASDLKPEARLNEDLELDSLDAIDMLVYLEDRVQVSIDIEKFKAAETLKDVYDIIHDIVTTQSIKFT